MPHRSVRVIAWAALALILALCMQAMLGLPYRPRFASVRANYWAVAALAAVMPVLAFLVAKSIPRTWLRRLVFVGAGVVMLPCVLISSCAVLEAPRPAEADSSFELLSETSAGKVAYRLYRTNCGATCAYGLELREELALPFGVKLVSPKWSLYRASEGALKLEAASVLVVNGDDVLGKVAR